MKLTETHVDEVFNLALKKIAEQSTANDYTKQIESLFWIRNEVIKLLNSKEEDIQAS